MNKNTHSVAGLLDINANDMINETILSRQAARILEENYEDIVSLVSSDGIPSFFSIWDVAEEQKAIRVIKKYPIDNTVMSIGSGLHSKILYPGHYLFETISKKPIKFVMTSYRNSSNFWITHFFVSKRNNQTYYIARWLKKMNKVNCSTKPIIHQEMFTNIMKDTIFFIKNASSWKQYDIFPKRGIIFSGPPGNGKTLLCNWLKQECLNHNVKVKEVSSTALMKAFETDTMSDLVNGTLNTGEIIFFDDIDISFFSRAHGDSKLACSLISAMDGLSNKKKNAVRIFTTNEDIKDMDVAFCRPGRIDRCYIFEKPDEKLREQVVQTWPQELTHGRVLDIVDETEDFSFAEMESVKSIAVHNFISDSSWDIDKALAEYEKTKFFSNKSDKRKGVYFGQ